jgi:hypothetical protein
MRKTMMAAALAMGCGALAVPASAQQQEGLVNVNVSDIDVMLNDIIADNNLNVQIPVNALVQVPIGLAANVCGTTVALLSAAGSAAECNADAENTTRGEGMAIARALQRQVRRQD